MRFIVAVATLFLAALSASAAPQESGSGCLETGMTCVMDPPSPGEIELAVEFCSDCCSGSFTPQLIGNTGVSPADIGIKSSCSLDG